MTTAERERERERERNLLPLNLVSLTTNVPQSCQAEHGRFKGRKGSGLSRLSSLGTGVGPIPMSRSSLRLYLAEW